VRKFEIPKHEFADLLTRSGRPKHPPLQTSTICWATCKNSANPVGHLVLYLCGYRDAERPALRLHLHRAATANFWQDVSADFAKDELSSARRPAPLRRERGRNSARAKTFRVLRDE